MNGLLLIFFIRHPDKFEKEICQFFLFHTFKLKSIGNKKKSKFFIFYFLDDYPADISEGFSFMGIFFKFFHQVKNTISFLFKLFFYFFKEAVYNLYLCHRSACRLRASARVMVFSEESKNSRNCSLTARSYIRLRI